MPSIRPFFNSTTPFALALAVKTEKVALEFWAKTQQRFPQRDVTTLPNHRQLEHFAVDSVLKHMGWDANVLQILHDTHGKPRLQSNDPQLSAQAISIAHSTEGELCHALVAIGPGPIGCDIEFERDTLRKIAHRVFAPDEGTAGSSISNLAALWTIKESMFKAFGPEIDFRKDLKISLPPLWKAETSVSWSLTGQVFDRQFHWNVSQQSSPLVNARVWICCGPLEIESA